MSDNLFQPGFIGAIPVENRIAMAPPARERAGMNGVHNQRRIAERPRTLGLAYPHRIEGQTRGDNAKSCFVSRRSAARSEARTSQNNGYDRELAPATVADGHADTIAFGRPFIANPDLPARLLRAAPLEEASPDLDYGGGAKGCTDFQPLDVAANGTASTVAGAAGELGR